MLFDIDGVIRDVGGSYRRALAETVHHYSGWRPEPHCIDALKSEGAWNNDWDASLELLRRNNSPLPTRQELIGVFSDFYFGGDPDGPAQQWHGFIGSEPLLLDADFFKALSAAGLVWGFVSGAEPPSARYVLEQRLGLINPPLVAMGDAPDKPNPQGLIQLASQLLARHGCSPLGHGAPPVAYLGDTVADVRTLLNAKKLVPNQRWLSLAVAPPHLHSAENQLARNSYGQTLMAAGADRLLLHPRESLEVMLELS
ncbi:TIGR01548 family HAD-type hydrolase [Synechococcus lacustris]|uniref:TIGR01548 family HAD-type hydrolase n=1 Tax=Synechococcus lacustris TaxID=2116544 RepID=UPI00333E6F5E